MKCAVKLLLLLILLTLICPAYYGQNTDSVVTEWVQRFNYCDTCLTNVDEAHHIGIDAQGNVYAGGYSTTSSWGTYTNFDFCVIKYSPSGEELLDARYDGAQHSMDLIYDMKVDEAGNVYATGPSLENDPNKPVYTTVKWNSDGVQQWVAHYNGNYQTSRSWAIAIDAAGNSYVTGSSLEGSVWLIATVKYNSSGVQQWVSKYSVGTSDGGIALVADNNGNVYVAGSTYNGQYFDYVTIKYNSTGVEQWHQIYNGAVGRDDIPTAIVLDTDQNIYVTGKSMSQGLGGGYYNDFCTIKYNPVGDQLWVARYDASIHGPDDSRDIVYDESTNSVVVTGGSYYNTSFSTFLTIKYNITTGDTIWTARYYTPYGAHDGANAITNDNSGNIYIVGGSIGNGTLYDYATVKYDPNGRQLWVRRYDGAQGLDYGYDIAADNTGSVYVTGTSPVPVTGPDYLTIKYSDISTFPLSVNINNGWNMVSVPGTNPDGMGVNTWWAFRDMGANVFKYSGGYQQVTTTTPGIGYWMKHTGPRTYNTGEEWPAGGIQIVAHNPITAAAGWNLFGGYELSVATSGLTTNPPGLITGSVYKYSGGYQQATTLDPGYGYWVKLTGAGEIIIPETLAKGEAKEFFKEDWGRIVLTDAAGVNYTLYAVKGDVDLSQYELPPAPPEGMFDIRFSSGRIAEDINSSVKTIDMSGVTYPLIVRAENMDIRLMDETGKLINLNLKKGEDVVISDAAIQKLMVSGELIPDKYSLEQNYPNPFNPSTVIEFSLPENVSNVRLTIYSILGEKITELVNTSLQAGRYSYQWNAQNAATGMYIYELRTDKFVSMKKMILLK